MDFDIILGFDMETDIGSYTPFYKGVQYGTPKILEILNRNNISATFYWTGHAAKHNPEMLQKVKEAGSEIGCHGLFHETLGDPIFPLPNNWPILPSEVEGRIAKATQIIKEVCGIQPRSFRCPRLWGSTKVLNVLEKLDYKTDASLPLYYYLKPYTPYKPAYNDWTKPGNMEILEIPNFCDLTMESEDKYQRDRDQWPLFRTHSAKLLMEKVNGFISYIENRNKKPVLCFYFHPWEFYPMPEGLIDFGECSVKPNSFIVKNCGSKAVEEFENLCSMLISKGGRFLKAEDLVSEY